MSKIIDGKILALKHEKVLYEQMKNLSSRPRLVTLSNYEDLVTNKYTELKGKKAAGLGVDFIVVYLVDHMRKEEVLGRIEKECENASNDGVMVQLPLPESLKKFTDEVLAAIDPKKDVDGLTGKGPVLQATVRGVLSILGDLGVDLKVSKIGVVGSEGFVGKGLVNSLEDSGARFIKVDKKLPETSLDDLKDTDIVISAVGIKDLIKPENIKNDAILIDIGLGDFDEGCYEKASAYTPPKGGVGPMTIISLMENLIDLCLNTKRRRN